MLKVKVVKLHRVCLVIILPLLMFLSACHHNDDTAAETSLSDDELISSPEQVLGEVTTLLESGAPDTTNEAFETSESYKNIIPEDSLVSARRAHDLVASAVDPDPEWFATGNDKQIILSQPGREHVVSLNKVTIDGQVLGPVDNDWLRLIVKIQRSASDIESIRDNDIPLYAQWEGPGSLKIMVPDNLNKGRLIVGIRPDFDDVGQAAIAERWSSYVLAEVWETKPDVKVLLPSDVLFPSVQGSVIGSSAESLFSLDEIADVVQNALTDRFSLELPIVINDVDLSVGDLVSYTLRDKPYAGRVSHIERRMEQVFALLEPSVFDVYEVTDTEEDFLRKEGVFPEHVIYRDGDPLQATGDESDPLVFQRKGLFSRLFDAECKTGGALATLKLSTDYLNQNIGLDMKLHLSPEKIDCTWKAKVLEVNILATALAATGPAAIIAKLFGAGVIVSPLGEIKLIANAPSVGIDVGGSISKGGYVKIGGLDDLNQIAHIGSRDLTLPAGEFVPKVEFGASAGVKIKVNLISGDSEIGLVMGLLGVSLKDIGMQAKGGFKSAVVAELPNASMVYTSKSSGSIGLKHSIFGELKLSPPGVADADSSEKMTTKLFRYLGLDSVLKFQRELEVFPGYKTSVDFAFSGVRDRPSGENGYASITGLALNNSFLESISPFEAKGVLGPVVEKLSFFNDPAESIEYKLEDCLGFEDSIIISPVYACSGPFCGKATQPISLCGGKVSITPVIAKASVGWQASANATITNHYALLLDAQVSAEGGTNSLKLSNDSASSEILESHGGTKQVEFSQTCPEAAGVYRGTIRVNAESGEEQFDDSADSILICSKEINRPPDPKPRPRPPFRWGITGDPHIVTADGMGYDYFASGDYVLSRIFGVSGYEVQARFLPGFSTSWPQASAIKVGNDVVEIQGRSESITAGAEAINFLKIWVNGRLTHYGTHPRSSLFYRLPSGGSLAITGVVNQAFSRRPINVSVIWPKGSQTENYAVDVKVNVSTDNPFLQLRVIRPNTFAGLERGLLGNNDGDPDNDFIRRNDSVLGIDERINFTQLYALFGMDWLAKPYESLFRNPEVIKPEFPSDVVTLTPAQRDFGEAACIGLTGFYREACIIDVGLLGTSDIIKEYYSDIDGLNYLSEAIVTPDVDRPVYELSTGSLRTAFLSRIDALLYNQSINVKHVSGVGNFLLRVRPPRGGSATLVNGQQSFFGSGDFTSTINVNCLENNQSTSSVLFSELGALQLWLQDPLSGIASRKVSEVPLYCGLVSSGDDIQKVFGDAAFSTPATAHVDGNLFYSSSDNTVASISRNGTVIIRGAGEVDITARLRKNLDADPDCQSEFNCEPLGLDSYKLTIARAPPQLSLGDDISQENTSSNFKVLASTPSDGEIIFTSSDTSFATIDENGVFNLTGKLGEFEARATVAESQNHLSGSDSKSITVVPGLRTLGLDTSVEVTWKAASNVDLYNLYYAQESFSGISLRDYSNLSGGTLVEGVSGERFVVEGLTTDTKYYFVLEAKSAAQTWISKEVVDMTTSIQSPDYVFFAWDTVAANGVHDVEPWVTDGTVAGTRMLTNINPNGSSTAYSSASDVKCLGSKCYFSATAETESIWETDGTESGTVPVPEFDQIFDRFNLQYGSEDVPGYLVFHARENGTYGYFALDINGDLSRLKGSMDDPVVWGDKVAFRGFSAINVNTVLHIFENGKMEEYVTDNGEYIANPYRLKSASHNLFYFTEQDSEYTLWAIDELTKKPTELYKFDDTVIYQTDTQQLSQSIGPKLYFSVSGQNGGLYVSDGTVTGTSIVKSFGSVDEPLLVKGLHEINGKVVFQVVRADAIGTDPSSGEGIWVSDGTESGTIRLRDPSLRAYSSRYSKEDNAVSLGDKYYFTNSKNELWVSDGTVEGTKLVIKLELPLVDFEGLTVHKNLLYFHVFKPDQEYGQLKTLWRSDGTASGTWSLGDHFKFSIPVEE